MEIREFKKQDFFEVAKLAEKVIDLSQKEIYQTLKIYFNWISESSSIALVVKEKEKIIAFITLEEYEKTQSGIIFEIGYIVVEEQYQRTKIATSLYEETIERLKETLRKKNCLIRLIKAEVSNQEKEIQKFYFGLGMEKVAEIPNYWSEGERMLLFIKRFN